MTPPKDLPEKQAVKSHTTENLTPNNNRNYTKRVTDRLHGEKHEPVNQVLGSAKNKANEGLLPEVNIHIP